MISKTSCTYICCACSNINTMDLGLALMATAGCQVQPCTPASQHLQALSLSNIWPNKSLKSKNGNCLGQYSMSELRRFKRVVDNKKGLVIQMKSSITFQCIELTFQDEFLEFAFDLK